MSAITAFCTFLVIVSSGCKRSDTPIQSGYILWKSKFTVSADKKALAIEVSKLVDTHQAGIISEDAKAISVLIDYLDLKEIKIFPEDQDSEWSYALFDPAQHRGAGQTIAGFHALIYLYGGGSAIVVLPLKPGKSMDIELIQKVEAVVIKSHSQTVF